MDLEGQGNYKKIGESNDAKDLVAILGATSADTLQLIAETLKNGDPSWAGPLSGVALGIPSYHILEPEISSQVDPSIYEQELALPSMTVEVEELAKPLRAIRGETPQGVA
jgi:betaine reductase